MSIINEVDLPENWALERIYNFTSEANTGLVRSSKEQFVKGEYPYIKMNNLSSSGKFELSNIVFVDADHKELAKGQLHDGDFVFNTRNSLELVGKCGVFSKTKDTPILFNNNLLRMQFCEVLPELVSYWFNSPIGKIQLKEITSATTNVAAIYQKPLLQLELPIPPLQEQKRIVEKLDSLLAQVETIQQRLNNLPDIIKRFRQSVLAAAVSGKLTEQWRKLHTKEAWKNLTIGEVTTFQNGFAFKSGWFSESGPFQIIKLANVKDDNLKLDAAPAFVDEKVAQEFIRFKPDVDDLLISMTGTKYKGDYGYVCRIPLSQKILINQRVGRIIPDKDKVCSKYLLHFMRSEIFRVEFFKGETGGVNQGNVGTKHIQSCPIKVPPIEEQTEIVRLIEQYFALADTLEKHLADAKARVDNLTQSILAKAFRGELVPQDPNDEPADKLLERIKTARLETEKLEKAAKKAAKVKR